MKICILTQPLHSNYGGLLQAFAVQTILKKMGHVVVTDQFGANNKISYIGRIVRFVFHFIMLFLLKKENYNPFQYFFKSFTRNLDKRIKYQNTDIFILKHIETIDFFKGNYKPTSNMINKFDALVVGSDQVWRPSYSYVPSYFLSFVNNTKTVCIAFCASFGLDSLNEFTPKNFKLCADAIKRFNAISVREDSGVTLCKKYFGIDAEHLLDPTFLLNKEDYLNLIEKEDTQINNKILMCYVLDKDFNKKAIIDHVCDHLQLNQFDIMQKDKNTSETKNFSNAILPSVTTWLAGFRDATFVITDSFHGTIFSIIFNKPFLVISNPKRGLARFTSLLKVFGLENRLIHCLNDISNNHFQPIDYTQINNQIKKWQEKSYLFLKKHLPQ